MSYPIDYDIEARQGSTLRKQFAWSVEDEPQDLTGWFGRMEVRTKASSDNVVLDASDYISVGGDEGTISLVVPASVMEDIAPRKYVYDLELVNPTGPSGEEVTALLAGRFVVEAEVTRTEG